MASPPAQVLLTLGRYRGAPPLPQRRATLGRLLDLRAIPVINENDTVATTEIRYGDNDRLAARVATMAGADLLVLFSDIDGSLYCAARARPGCEAHPAGAEDHGRDRGDGRRPGLELLARRHAHQDRGGHDRGGRRHAYADRRRAGEEPARCGRQWRALHLVPDRLDAGHGAQDLDRRVAGAARARCHVDAGAARALRGGASLLPVGVSRIEGEFARGDAVLIRDPDGRVLGRGLVAYDAGEAALVLGKASRDIEAIFGLSRACRDDPPGRHGARRWAKVGAFD